MNLRITNQKAKRRLPLFFLALAITGLSSCNKEDDPEAKNIEPIASFTISDETPLTDVEIELTNTSSDTDGSVVSFSWDFGNDQSSTEESPKVSFADAGTFTITLTATDDGGATATASKDIVVSDGSPSAAFNVLIAVDSISNEEIIFGRVYTDSIFFKGMEITFTDGSSDADGTVSSYSWDFGDGTTSTDQNTKHTFNTEAETYNVSLTVTDNDNRSNTFTKKIHIVGTKWKFLTNAMETAAPSIDGSGNIYFGDRSGFIYKLSPEGTQLWSFEAGERVRGSIALSDDDATLYVGSSAEKFYAINASSGAEIWSVDVVGKIDKSSPCLDASGNLYVGTSDGVLYSFDNTGTQRWTFDGNHADGSIQSSPLFYDGKVYIAIDSVVYGVNASSGTQAWAYVMDGDRFEGHFALNDAGVLYGGADENDDNYGAVFAINTADGSEVWKKQVPGEVRANSPIVAADGSVLYTTEDGDDGVSMAFYRLDGNSGAELAKGAPAKDDFKVGGALGSSGIYYVGSNDDRFHLVESSTGLPMLTLSYESADHSMVPAIAEDGTVYFGNRGSFFYAMHFLDSETPQTLGWAIGGDNKNQDRK